MYLFACKYNLSCIIITDMLGSRAPKGFLTQKKVCLSLQGEVRCSDQHTIIKKGVVYFEKYGSFVI